MGLASLFRKKTNYFKTNIEPQCAYCQFSRRPEGGTRIVCEKLGLKEETDSCKKFVYSPLKRIPVKQLNIEGAVSDQEMYVEISEEELAAKQAAAAKADAAEKVHDENKAKAEAEQKARLAAEARAKQEAEQKARQEAEARAKAEQAKREQEAAAKAAEEAARAKAALDAKAAAETALAEAKAKEDAKAAAAATISEYKAKSAELDDEFSDLDMVEEAEVRAAEEHEVMHSKKQRLVAESESPKGAVPNLPPASAFLRNNKKKN